MSAVSEKKGQNVKVLIVDDMPTNLRLLRAVLEAENFNVVEASDGEQALAVLEREAVDAVISDILMPRMDGYRLCQEVRKNKRLQTMPFIFYTASYTSPGDEQLGINVGGDKYLRKPAAAREILAAVRELLNADGAGRTRSSGLLSETDIMKEYSERLVCKLEKKNEALASRTKELEQAQAELLKAYGEMESRVQQRTAELKAANQELESFSYSVSHDLRAPLRHINGFINIVLENCAGQLSETNLKNLQKVSAAARTMGELIGALLELSQVTRAEINRCSVDLSALASEVCAELQQTEPQRAVKLEIAPGLNADGDPRLLRIVLCNLLGNAWKYSRKRPEARIEFGKTDGEGVDTYFVRDNGAGFDMAYADKLFGAFQRLHRNDEFEGIGVGLATVQRIIRRHHGTIRAESVEHEGTTFYFTLGGEDSKKTQLLS